ncbi:hypothetical protein FIA56_12065 [Testudinibacter sp. TR-2022]|uniref:CPCC family cysteine-rich protein n=1 Tax=Testudinibacter sp. TR-2022 TaxID=2585029 RepID=UPI001118A3E4|nr:CPCC family cysteine-rich protein [Testudinibacter sp. TR-2022]TNH10615.1 hypothetical protein FIA56_12065 [Testudinibacter sp. TR-2022]TNH14011.1 hypothetical protein FHQ23_11455 [Testudinibacter sp. TR-2022]
MNVDKYRCPCCGNYSLFSEREYEICNICGWEDDPIQFDDPDFYGGANLLSLNKSREVYYALLKEIF